jgi:hypothetical protein
MKNLVIILAFFSQINLSAQTNESFVALKQAINNVHPEIDFTNKLIFISAWKSTDFESRELNKEAYRVYKIYEKAKLKNGEKGTVFISLNLDTDNQSRVFAIGKDGVDESVVYSDSELLKIIESDFNSSTPQNILVIDKTGTIQYRNITREEIFPSLRNLITR